MKYKFRGMRVDDDQWVYGVPVESVNGKVYMIHGATEDAINTPNEVDFYYTKVKPETVGMWTGLKDKNRKDIYDGDIVNHGNFYWDSGSSEDWFGTEPQVSFRVVEAYPEIVESVVCFVNGMYVFMTNYKNYKNHVRCPVGHVLNEDWSIVDAFEEQEPRQFKNMLEESECESGAGIKAMLSTFEITGNIHEVQNDR